MLRSFCTFTGEDCLLRYGWGILDQIFTTRTCILVVVWKFFMLKLTTSFDVKTMSCLWKYHGYLDNYWTKHRHVCTHSDAYPMLIPNMGTVFNICGFFYTIYETLRCCLHSVTRAKLISSPRVSLRVLEKAILF